MGRGAGNLPLYYEGPWDATLPYLPRQVVTSGGATYMATARSTNAPPATNPSSWLALTAGGPIYLEAIVKSGAAAVAANLMPPGFRVPADTTLRAVYVNLGTAPTGSGLTVIVKRAGTTLSTVNVAAGGTSGSDTGLSTALAKGDLLTVDISAVGSTVAGADVLVTVEGY